MNFFLNIILIAIGNILCNCSSKNIKYVNQIKNKGCFKYEYENKINGISSYKTLSLYFPKNIIKANEILIKDENLEEFFNLLEILMK